MKKLHRSDIALLLGDLNTEASLLAWASSTPTTNARHYVYFVDAQLVGVMGKAHNFMFNNSTQSSINDQAK